MARPGLEKLTVKLTLNSDALSGVRWRWNDEN